MDTSGRSSFERDILPKYANYYVSYKQLLDAIDVLRNRDAHEDATTGLLKGLMLPKDFTFGDTTALYTMVEQKPETRFGALIEHELSKVNHFTLLEVKTILSNLRVLEKRLVRLSAPRPDIRSSRSMLFPSVADDLTTAGAKSANSIPAIQERLASLCDEIVSLDQYVRVNMKLFENVVADFDRVFGGSSPIGSLFLAKLPEEQFAKCPINGLVTAVSLLSKRLQSPSLAKHIPPTLPSQHLTPCLVSKENLARLKLSLASSFPVSIAGMEFASVPTHSDDLSQRWLSPSTHWVDIVVGDTEISFSVDSTRSSPAAYITRAGQREPVLSEQLPGLLNGTTVLGPCHHLSYDIITFEGGIELVENVRVTSLESFDLKSALEHLPRRGSVGAHTYEADRTDLSLLYLPVDSHVADFSGLVSPLSWRTKVELLKEGCTQVVPPRDAVSDNMLQRRFSVPTPIVLAAIPNGKPETKPAIPSASSESVMIYPKNYMANERSCLAWISACSVQAGLGIALLGRENSSLLGGVVSMCSLWFLWWAIYVFVQRFRFLRKPESGEDRVFYSMRLPTAFGITQLIVLTLQALLIFLA